jgi:hypothetical protein
MSQSSIERTLEQNNALLERLCQAIEALHGDLRPELRRTETLRRVKEERLSLEQDAAEAVASRRKLSRD